MKAGLPLYWDFGIVVEYENSYIVSTSDSPMLSIERRTNWQMFKLKKRVIILIKLLISRKRENYEIIITLYSSIIYFKQLLSRRNHSRR